MAKKENRILKQITGRKVAVTGGTKGIGLAIAALLHEQGANVALCGRSQESVDAGLGQLRSSMPGGGSREAGILFGSAADMSKREEAERFIHEADQALGGLDTLINNAGSGVFRSTEELEPVEWDRMIALNLSGPFYCSHAALPLFRKGGGGDIINISSLAGKNSFAGGAGYNASKFGLNGFSEAMMLDHRDDDVRVSYIMPGSVDTGFGGSNSGSDWKIAPEDIADVVLLLLQMPQRTLVSRVEMRPSRPSRKS